MKYTLNPLKISEAERNRRILAAIHDARRRDRKSRRPVWTRTGFWQLVWCYAKGLKHDDVDRREYDREFEK